MEKTTKRILVTGGTGFIGNAIALALAQRGHQVLILSRTQSKEPHQKNMTHVKADVRDKSSLISTLKNVDTVFHAAAKIGYWGNLQEYQDININGTENVLSAALECGVKKIIYTSTPSVVGYENHVRNGGSNIPYANSYLSAYAETKAEAEKLVLHFNAEELATISLRPHLVFGPKDVNLVPLILKRSIEGKLPIIGKGDSIVDLTFIDNVVEAHLCAMESLTDSDSKCAGKAYFISNGEPVNFYQWVEEILFGLGYNIKLKHVNENIAYIYAYLQEIFFKNAPIFGEPSITRFLVKALSKDHWYDMSFAQRDIGYKPKKNMKEATALTISWLRNISEFKSMESSK